MKKFSIVLLFLNRTLIAESFTGGVNNNPFLNAVPGTVSRDSQSKPEDSRFYQNASTIFDNSIANGQNGREYKYQDLVRQHEAGNKAAAAAGAALTAAAAVAFGLSQWAEGARLMGLAGKEFAQAKSDRKTASYHSSMRDTLLANADQSWRQDQYDPIATAKELKTPQVEAALIHYGVDPDSFLQALANGDLTTPDKVARALGKDPSTLTTQEAATLSDTSGDDIQEILSGVGLGVNEDAGLNSDGSMNAVAANTGAGLGTGAIQSESASSAVLDQARAGALHSEARNPKVSGFEKNDSDVALAVPNGLNGIFAKAESGEEKADPTQGMSRMDLKALGVTHLRGQTIFKVAARNYHSFSKWRGIKKERAPQRGIASIP